MIGRHIESDTLSLSFSGSTPALWRHQPLFWLDRFSTFAETNVSFLIPPTLNRYLRKTQTLFVLFISVHKSFVCALYSRRWLFIASRETIHLFSMELQVMWRFYCKLCGDPTWSMSPCNPKSFRRCFTLVCRWITISHMPNITLKRFHGSAAF